MMSYTCAGVGCGVAGFGLDVPTPLPGNLANVSNMTETGYNHCGSKYGFQQMLNDLGFNAGPVDGMIGSQTLAAARAFGQQHGVPLTATGIPDAFCTKLFEVWAQKMGGGTQEVPPPKKLSISLSTLQRLQPFQPSQIVGTQSRATPGSRLTDDASAAASGGVLDKAKAWWSGASTGTKAAVGIGAAAVVGLTIYALTGGGSASAPAAATPNARKPASKSTPPRRYVVEWQLTRHDKARQTRFRTAKQAVDHAERLADEGNTIVTVWRAPKGGGPLYKGTPIFGHYGKREPYGAGPSKAKKRKRKATRNYNANRAGASARKIRLEGRRKKVGKVATLEGGHKYGHTIIPMKYWRLGARRPSDFADPEHLKYPLVFREPSGRVKPKETREHIAAAKSYFTKWKHRYPMSWRRKFAKRINAASKRYGGGPTVVTP